MPKPHALPEQNILAQILDYCPESGALTWRARGVEWFRDGKHSAQRACQWWNARFAGKPALARVSVTGYLKGNLFYGNVLAHRVVWKLCYGSDADHIDHVNGIRSDNRLANLRSVSPQENSRNLRTPCTNTSGAMGVHWCKTTGKWCAQVRVTGKRITLGYFTSIDEAVAARAAANIKFGFHENHGRTSFARGA